MDQAPQAEHREGEDDERKIEQRLVAHQLDREEAEIGRQAFDVQQAVLTAGDAVPFDRDEPEHLAEGDGEQRVIDAAPVRDEGRHRRAEGRSDEHRAKQVEP